jgi:hypothetical protein
LEQIIETANIMTPAWAVCAWPTLLWQAAEARGLELMHLGTQVLTKRDEGQCSGQTLWGKQGQGEAAGLAWDWVEIREGVVAMADPLGVITNVRFLNDRGEALPEREVAIRLQRLVHALPWQTEVRRALQPANA